MEVYARVVQGRTLYVNTTGENRKITISGKVQEMISHQVYESVINLGPYQVDLVE